MKNLFENSASGFASWITFIIDTLLFNRFLFFLFLFLDFRFEFKFWLWLFLMKFESFLRNKFWRCWRLWCFLSWISFFGYVLLEVVLKWAFFGLVLEFFVSEVLEWIYFYLIFTTDKQHRFTSFHFIYFTLLLAKYLIRIQIVLHIIQINQITRFLCNSNKFMF